MNEDGVTLLLMSDDVSRAFASVFDGIARRQAGAGNWCDHCWYGDHDVCKEWFGPECKCTHENPEEGR